MIQVMQSKHIILGISVLILEYLVIYILRHIYITTPATSHNCLAPPITTPLIHATIAADNTCRGRFGGDEEEDLDSIKISCDVMVSCTLLSMLTPEDTKAAG